MGIRREWLDNNILDSFDIFYNSYKFEFTVHPQDPEMDMTHYFVEKPSISLIMKVKNTIGVVYSVVLLLSAKLSLEEIKQKAKQMIDSAGVRWMKKQTEQKRR